jgi:hypothetical protein
MGLGGCEGADSIANCESIDVSDSVRGHNANLWLLSPQVIKCLAGMVDNSKEVGMEVESAKCHIPGNFSGWVGDDGAESSDDDDPEGEGEDEI